MDRCIILGMILLASMAIIVPAADATITYVRIVNSTGDALNLSHDDPTQSYADGSSENPTAFLKICTTNSTSELVGKFVGLFYREGSIAQPVHILPGRISLADISGNCTTMDLDFGFLAARYPAFPAIGISSNANMASATYYFPWLDGSDGMLEGNFTFSSAEMGHEINFTITSALDESLNTISTNKTFIVASLRRSNGVADDAAQVGINESVLLDWSGDNDYYFSINGIPFGSPACRRGEVLCSDRVCRPPEQCEPLDCKNGTANNICEYGEGCGCLDCNGQQDSCAPSLYCMNGKCDKTEVAAPVSGPSAPFNCTWNNTYSEGLPAGETKLFFYHDCTPLREISITLATAVANATILTLGNDTVIQPPPPNPPRGYVFDYFKVEHDIPEDKFTSVLMQFKIPKAALQTSGFAREDVTLRKLTPEGWKVFPATFVSEDNTFYFFESRIDGLSLFAVVGEKAAPTPPPPAVVVPPAMPPQAAAPAIPIVPLAIAILAVITVLALAYRYHIRKKPKRAKIKAKMRPRAPPAPPPPRATELQQRLAQIQRDVMEMEYRLRGKR